MPSDFMPTNDNYVIPDISETDVPLDIPKFSGDPTGEVAPIDLNDPKFLRDMNMEGDGVDNDKPSEVDDLLANLDEDEPKKENEKNPSEEEPKEDQKEEEEVDDEAVKKLSVKATSAFAEMRRQNRDLKKELASLREKSAKADEGSTDEKVPEAVNEELKSLRAVVSSYALESSSEYKEGVILPYNSGMKTIQSLCQEVGVDYPSDKLVAIMSDKELTSSDREDKFDELATELGIPVNKTWKFMRSALRMDSAVTKRDELKTHLEEKKTEFMDSIRKQALEGVQKPEATVDTKDFTGETVTKLLNELDMELEDTEKVDEVIKSAKELAKAMEPEAFLKSALSDKVLREELKKNQETIKKLTEHLSKYKTASPRPTAGKNGNGGKKEDPSSNLNSLSDVSSFITQAFTM